jgi:uncharacterized protein
MFEKDDLVKIAQVSMPFGKYQGQLLIDLPEAYLLWFVDRGFPKGRLGDLMQLTLEIKINGLESLLEPFRLSQSNGPRTAAAYVFPANQAEDD